MSAYIFHDWPHELAAYYEVIAWAQDDGTVRFGGLFGRRSQLPCMKEKGAYLVRIRPNRAMIAYIIEMQYGGM